MPLIDLTLGETIAIVVINNPPVNALSTEVIQELDKAIDQIHKAPRVKSVILTGHGMVFIAGANIKEIAQLKGAKQAEEAAVKGQTVIGKIAQAPIPWIAAINGPCLGGGNELAIACHFRISGDRALFGQPEINLGLIPGFGGTQRLPRLLGASRALQLLLTGDNISAQEAQMLGLVNKVVPQSELLKHSQDLARRIASRGKPSIQKIMRAVREGSALPLQEALALEAKLFGETCETQDMREGVTAFIEKRQPQFNDK